MGRLRRTLRGPALLAALLLALLPGCETEEGLDFILMQPVLSVAPSPVIAEASTNPAFDWVASFVVTVTETSGMMGGDIERITTTVFDTVSGVQVEGAMIVVDPETARLDSGGVVTLSFEIHYGLPGGARAATFGVTMALLDDNPVTYARSISVDAI